jgi:PAS domain S-box-containing protein
MSRLRQQLAAIFTGSVKRQLIWGVAMVHAVMMSLFVYDLSIRQGDFLIESQASEAGTLAKNLSLVATSPLLSSDLSGLQELTLSISRYPGVVHAMVIGVDGKILAHEDPTRRGQFLVDFPHLSEQIAPQVVLQKSSAQADVATAIALNGQRLGWVRVVVSQDETASRLANILRTGLLYTTVAILAGILLAWALAKRLTLRLRALVDVADAVRLGGLQTRAQIGGGDELSHLGQAFNFMLSSLEARKRDEHALALALQVEKELAQVTLASIGDAVITTDKLGRVTFMNASACSLTGLMQADARGQPITEVFSLVGLGTKLPLNSPVHAVLQAEGKAGIEFLGGLLTRLGSTIAVESRASPICTADGHLAGCVLVARDVSKQLEAQSRLEEINESLERRVTERTSELARANQAALRSEQFIRTVTDALPSMIGYWDRDLRCKFANKAYEKWFNVRVETIVGMHIREVLGEALYAMNAPRMRLALEGQVQIFDREAHRATGELGYMAAKYLPHVLADEVLGFFVLVEDITELKQAESRLMELNQALSLQVQVASNANLAKSEFLANMSHEIRTPLSAIAGMAKLVAREPLSSTQKERMGKLDSAVNHLSFTINDILDLSKIEANSLVLEDAPVDLNALVGNIVSMTQDSLQAKGLQLQVLVEPMPVILMGDSTRLAQALLNYVSNAVKFTDAGAVTLRVTLADETPDSALIRFEVHDTGVGIAAEMIPLLFEPFVQADSSTTRKYGGTGLGLTIAKRLAEAMGGAVGALSEPGMGSTFWFSARLKKGSVLSAPQAGTYSLALEALTRDFAGRRVLLVEDDEFNREIGNILLQDCGFRVDEAKDGREAVGMAMLGDYDLILMDMQMPNMDGLEATAKIRSTLAGAPVPIIAMTANAFADDKQRCLDAGMNDFITKPVDPGKLYQAILNQFIRPATPAKDR